jgi:hypothetical protein
MAARYAFTPITANGSTVLPLPYTGSLQFIGAGAFGAGTLILEISPDNGVTWVALTGASWTAAFNAVVTVGQGCQVRATLSGATAPAINLWATHTVADLASQI